MLSQNGLVCFTNCLLPQEDGTLIEKDLWIDERRGVILNAQKTFFLRKQRPDTIIDLGGNILSPGLIDIQINGAYGFDFSVFDGDEAAYRQGLRRVAENIVETGVTSLVPTIVTQERSLYPKLLELLKPLSAENSAALLGWHAEGPFIDMAKRGAHTPSFLLSAPEGLRSFEELYGVENLAEDEDWLMGEDVGVRIITAAPEIKGVMAAIEPLTKRGIAFSIGHSIATSEIATTAVKHGACLITHLFNAMPQLHHRDPSIIGLLGSSPHLASPFTPITVNNLFNSPGSPKALSRSSSHARSTAPKSTPVPASEAFDEIETPPQSPILASVRNRMAALSRSESIPSLKLDSTPMPQKQDFERPFYELIVDGIHSHPNSVRLAYSAFPEGCILITDAMKILDPNLRDGVHEWRDGKRFVKEGDKLYLEGTDTLAGSVVTLDKCVRNFSRFTGASIGQALKCATFNPAKCLGIENKKGTLRPGADADLVVLDREGEVQSTWVKGKQVWKRA
ncbi:n-acetylglucosamine-6-phosphate deacetylase [Moniliophthora roreri MCA 2997]|uniref:N-acetylglucosamine-6-phosphate deacetylase n=1 Tax=Moniliophthora roreri (strain MCA 2997) TaxID=1381753 RepID=V2XUB1_MONRO|nr:n-acetylglucosamine-6-phosphate deacetylase [Moniliophthora roreri MCA 2997]